MWLEKGIGEEKRWFYPISAFIIGAATFVTQLWTMFYPHIQAHFGLETTASIVLAATFSGMGVMIIGPPITGTILDKYGPKIPFMMSAASFVAGHSLIFKMLTMKDWSTAMYLWYLGSFLVGLGAGFYSGTYTATVGKWFPDKPGTAMGLAVAGAGSGTVIYSPLVASLIRSYGFSGNVFLLFAIIALVALVGLGIPFWKTPPHDWVPAGMQPKSKSFNAKSIHIAKDYTLQEAVKDKRFWLLYVCFICAAFSNMFFVQNASLIIIEGLTQTMSREDILASVVPLFLTISALAGLLGRFGWGVISDKLGGPWKTLWMVYLFPAILMSAFYLGYHSVMLIFIIGFLLYFGFGGEPVVHYAIVPYVFGRRHLGKIMSTLNAFSVGIGIAFGPYVGAYIKDVTGGYYWALVLAIVIRLCGTAFALLGLRLAQQQESSAKA
ncbi:MFS transporter [Thermosediminibacter litoriperuensis]|uniref:Putative MFS family arabinose efflux permease n=1 Tax=Thermosediminibacter litoriperuensis TaxID=291989 RepID=A0A5S5AV82_9FIRM|nr:MFS transporter [Thermosediminibacter litoriperuensis]TYP56638.1 putative MFS family arabinose efflux permease [Thermosediminibacter litoriperuensis]